MYLDLVIIADVKVDAHLFKLFLTGLVVEALKVIPGEAHLRTGGR